MNEVFFEELRARAERLRATMAALAGYQQQVDEQQAQLEGPLAAREYLAFFIDHFGRAAAEVERVASELSSVPQPAHVDALRQVASNAAAEQRRIVMFRDKWVNKPLPYEAQRPLLTGMSNAVRDQIDALRTLIEPAAAIEAAFAPPPADTESDSKALDRRQLFTRLFRPPDDSSR